MDPQNLVEINKAIRSALSAKNSGGGEAACILVAEQDRHFRETIAQTLVGEGYQVLAFADGRQAIDAIERLSVDLVITGITMPEASGLVVISTLRRRFPQLKFVALARGTEPRCNTSAARAFGASHVLANPVDPAELLGVVRELLGEKG
jgi:CheY-like chemotaxis protein